MWILLAFLCAFFLALTDFFTKKYSKRFSDRELVFGRVLFSVPILWLIALTDGIPVINNKLFIVFLCAIPLEIIALLLYVKSLRVSPLSATVPFLSFTPVFLLITSSIMINEVASVYGIVGIVVIVLGAYLLNIRSFKKGILFPFKMILQEPGSVYMIIVAFIYSITSVFGKIGVLSSSPSFFAASYLTLLVIAFYILYKNKINFKELLKKELILIGAFSALMFTFHMLAVKLANVSYMISIKRSSLLFGIIFGFLFFNEKNFLQKIIGGILMMLGILIIGFYG